MNIQTAPRWPNEGGASLSDLHYPASMDGRLTSRLDGNRLILSAGDGSAQVGATLSLSEGRLSVDDVVFAGRRLDEPHLLAALLDAALRLHPQFDRVFLPSAKTLWQGGALATETIVTGEADGEKLVVHRHVLRQLPLLWRKQASHVAYPELPTAIGPADRLPPLRPPRPAGLMYERFLPDLGLTISLRPIDRRSDLDLFHGWMNDGRVAFFWELAQSREELDRYLADQESDPHIFGVIASFDGEPTGYFEFYWAKEDRLGPYYQPQDYDRGWHGLIGNVRHLGRPKTLAIFRSVTHYLFLDEPRTLRIVGEPRAAHQKMLSYCADTGYDKVKEFDFPHKRAMLVCCERERFFREVPL